MDKLNVLFLCTGNPCRSQTAEALLRKREGDTYDVPFVDPAEAQGTDAQKRGVFRRVRDEPERAPATWELKAEAAT